MSGAAASEGFLQREASWLAFNAEEGWLAGFLGSRW